MRSTTVDRLALCVLAQRPKRCADPYLPVLIDWRGSTWIRLNLRAEVSGKAMRVSLPVACVPESS